LAFLPPPFLRFLDLGSSSASPSSSSSRSDIMFSMPSVNRLKM
jgi:hypothetical protein